MTVRPGRTRVLNEAGFRWGMGHYLGYTDADLDVFEHSARHHIDTLFVEWQQELRHQDRKP
jgi:hypothetical protein